MALGNTYKFVVALTAIVGGFLIVLLALTDVVSHDNSAGAITLGTNLITGPLWYIIGNGVAAKSNTPVQAIITTKETKS